MGTTPTRNVERVDVSITLNSTVEAQIAALANIPDGSYDPGSLAIDLINPAGPTTLRYTIPVSVDTPSLVAILKAALP